MNKKKIAVLMAVMLLIGVASGATLAWLKANTNPVTNVFTVGDINIDLFETKDLNNDGDKNDTVNNVKENHVTGEVGYHVVPGDVQEKDPRVVVEANSEDCYVFLKMVVANNSYSTTSATLKHILTWEMMSDWTLCTTMGDAAKYGNDTTPNDGTYYFYRTYTKNAEQQSYFALADNEINVSGEVTKEMLTGANNILEKQPRVEFGAAAVQSKNIVDATKSDAENLAAIIDELPTAFYNPVTGN